MYDPEELAAGILESFVEPLGMLSESAMMHRLSGFSSGNVGTSGMRVFCPEAEAEAKRAWDLAHPEQKRAQEKFWRMANRERVRAKSNEYQRNRRARLKAAA